MKTKDLFNFIIIVWALALPTTLWADDYDDFKPYTENDITYIIYEDEHGEKYAETFAYGRLKGDFVIPAYITKDSIPVKILAGSYEWAMEDLRSLTIPATVEKIDPIRVTPQSYMAPQFHDFYVDADNPYYESCEGLLFTKDGVLIGWPYTNGMDSETITVPEGTIGIEASVMFQIDTCDPKVLVFPSTLEAVDRDLPVDDYDLTVICRATTPPRLNNCNPMLHQKYVVLYVPNGYTEVYRNDGQWGDCREIKEITGYVTGIRQIEEPTVAPEAVFSLDGRRLDKPRKGANIVKGKDGQVRKVLSIFKNK